jgi:hypothetical protein
MSDLTPRCLHGTEWFALLGDVEAHARAMQRSRRPWLERLPVPLSARLWAEGKAQRDVLAALPVSGRLSLRVRLLARECEKLQAQREAVMRAGGC